MFPDICETPKHSNNLLYLLLTTSGLCLGPASRSYRKKTESAAAPRAVPDALALGYARLLIVEERQLAQSLAMAHDLAEYLVTTLAQGLVRTVRGSISLDTKLAPIGTASECKRVWIARSFGEFSKLPE